MLPYSLAMLSHYANCRYIIEKLIWRLKLRKKIVCVLLALFLLLSHDFFLMTYVMFIATDFSFGNNMKCRHFA